jgi:hypothetical protein
MACAMTRQLVSLPQISRNTAIVSKLNYSGVRTTENEFALQIFQRKQARQVENYFAMTIAGIV